MFVVYELSPIRTEKVKKKERARACVRARDSVIEREKERGWGGESKSHPWVNKTKQHTPFEEEEEGAGTAKDIVKVGGEVEGDLATPGCLREDRARRYVGDSQSWVRLPWFARDETPGP